jgi:hypothetical protein
MFITLSLSTSNLVGMVALILVIQEHVNVEIINQYKCNEILGLNSLEYEHTN